MSSNLLLNSVSNSNCDDNDSDNSSKTENLQKNEDKTTTNNYRDSLFFDYLYAKNESESDQDFRDPDLYYSDSEVSISSDSEFDINEEINVNKKYESNTGQWDDECNNGNQLFQTKFTRQSRHTRFQNEQLSVLSRSSGSLSANRSRSSNGSNISPKSKHSPQPRQVNTKHNKIQQRKQRNKITVARNKISSKQKASNKKDYYRSTYLEKIIFEKEIISQFNFPVCDEKGEPIKTEKCLASLADRQDQLSIFMELLERKIQANELNQKKIKMSYHIEDIVNYLSEKLYLSQTVVQYHVLNKIYYYERAIKLMRKFEDKLFSNKVVCASCGILVSHTFSSLGVIPKTQATYTVKEIRQLPNKNIDRRWLLLQEKQDDPNQLYRLPICSSCKKESINLGVPGNFIQPPYFITYMERSEKKMLAQGKIFSTNNFPTKSNYKQYGKMTGTYSHILNNGSLTTLYHANKDPIVALSDKNIENYNKGFNYLYSQSRIFQDHLCNYQIQCFFDYYLSVKGDGERDHKKTEFLAWLKRSDTGKNDLELNLEQLTFDNIMPELQSNWKIKSFENRQEHAGIKGKDFQKNLLKSERLKEINPHLQILQLEEPPQFDGDSSYIHTGQKGYKFERRDLIKIYKQTSNMLEVVEEMQQKIPEARALPFNYQDKYVEELLFPTLFVEGCGGYNSTYAKYKNLYDYFQMQLLNGDSRWRLDQMYPYYGYELTRSKLIQQYNKFITTTVNQSQINSQGMSAGFINTNSQFVYDSRPKLMPVMAGSFKSWQQKYYQLASCIAEKGSPDLFITLTLNDREERLLKFIKHMNDGRDVRPQDDPLMTALYFKHKFAVLKQIIAGDIKGNYKKRAKDSRMQEENLHQEDVQIKEKKKKRKHRSQAEQLLESRGMFGYGKFCFWRIEYQDRGAPHLHLILTLDDADKARMGDQAVICATKTRGMFSTFNIPGYGKNLHDLVNTIQQHGKCQSYCLRKGLRCRFGFPFATKSFDSLNERGFNFLYRRKEEEDERTVPYSRELLLLSQCHIDVLYCTPGQISAYLTKYIAKNEVLHQIEKYKEEQLENKRNKKQSDQKSYNQIVEDVLLKNDKDCDDEEDKNLSKSAKQFIREIHTKEKQDEYTLWNTCRVVSITEAIYILFRVGQVGMTPAAIYIPNQVPQFQRRRLKKKEIVSKLPENSKDIIKWSHLEFYRVRPGDQDQDLESATFVDFLCDWEYSKSLKRIPKFIKEAKLYRTVRIESDGYSTFPAENEEGKPENINSGDTDDEQEENTFGESSQLDQSYDNGQDGSQLNPKDEECYHDNVSNGDDNQEPPFRGDQEQPQEEEEAPNYNQKFYVYYWKRDFSKVPCFVPFVPSLKTIERLCYTLLLRYLSHHEEQELLTEVDSIQYIQQEGVIANMRPYLSKCLELGLLDDQDKEDIDKGRLWNIQKSYSMYFHLSKKAQEKIRESEGSFKYLNSTDLMYEEHQAAMTESELAAEEKALNQNAAFLSKICEEIDSHQRKQRVQEMALPSTLSLATLTDKYHVIGTVSSEAQFIEENDSKPGEEIPLKIHRLTEIVRILQDQNGLTRSQLALLSVYVQKHNERLPLRLRVVGRPGVGKTFILQILSDLDVILYKQQIVKCAFTGTAADRLKTPFAPGYTLHSFLGLKVENLPTNKVTCPELTLLDSRMLTIQKTQSYYVDEIYLCPGSFMNFMVDRIKSSHDQKEAESLGQIVSKKDPFRYRSILMSGDYMQTIQNDRDDPMEGNALFMNCLDPFFLVDNKRHQGDAPFLKMLNDLREVDLTSHDEMPRDSFNTLMKCFCKLHSQDGTLACPGVLENPDTTILVSVNEDRVRINNLRLKHAQEVLGKQLVTVSAKYFTSNEQMQEILEPLLVSNLITASMYLGRKQGVIFPENLTLFVGCRIMILRNLDTQQGITNGATGVVNAISDFFLEVKMLNTGKIFKILRAIESIRHNSVTYYRMQFPADNADCMTIHKCQGSTMGNGPLMIMCKRFFNDIKGMQFYSAISRSTSLNLVHVVCYDRDLSSIFREDGVYRKYRQEEKAFEEKYLLEGASDKQIKNWMGKINKNITGLIRDIQQEIKSLKFPCKKRKIEDDQDENQLKPHPKGIKGKGLLPIFANEEGKSHKLNNLNKIKEQYTKIKEQAQKAINAAINSNNQSAINQGDQRLYVHYSPAIINDHKARFALADERLKLVEKEISGYVLDGRNMVKFCVEEQDELNKPDNVSIIRKVLGFEPLKQEQIYIEVQQNIPGSTKQIQSGKMEEEEKVSQKQQRKIGISIPLQKKQTRASSQKDSLSEVFQKLALNNINNNNNKRKTNINNTNKSNNTINNNNTQNKNNTNNINNTQNNNKNNKSKNKKQQQQNYKNEIIKEVEEDEESNSVQLSQQQQIVKQQQQNKISQKSHKIIQESFNLLQFSYEPVKGVCDIYQQEEEDFLETIKLYRNKLNIIALDHPNDNVDYISLCQSRYVFPSDIIYQYQTQFKETYKIPFFNNNCYMNSFLIILGQTECLQIKTNEALELVFLTNKIFNEEEKELYRYVRKRLEIIQAILSKKQIVKNFTYYDYMLLILPLYNYLFQLKQKFQLNILEFGNVSSQGDQNILKSATRFSWNEQTLQLARRLVSNKQRDFFEVFSQLVDRFFDDRMHKFTVGSLITCETCKLSREGSVGDYCQLMCYFKDEGQMNLQTSVPLSEFIVKNLLPQAEARLIDCGSTICNMEKRRCSFQHHLIDFHPQFQYLMLDQRRLDLVIQGLILQNLQFDKEVTIQIYADTSRVIKLPPSQRLSRRQLQLTFQVVCSVIYQNTIIQEAGDYDLSTAGHFVTVLNQFNTNRMTVCDSMSVRQSQLSYSTKDSVYMMLELIRVEDAARFMQEEQ